MHEKIHIWLQFSGKKWIPSFCQNLAKFCKKDNKIKPKQQANTCPKSYEELKINVLDAVQNLFKNDDK